MDQEAQGIAVRFGPRFLPVHDAGQRQEQRLQAFEQMVFIIDGGKHQPQADLAHGDQQHRGEQAAIAAAQ